MPCIRWAGRPHTARNIFAYLGIVKAIVWQYTREDLIVAGRMYQVGGRPFTTEDALRKKSSQGNKHRSLLKGRWVSDSESPSIKDVPGPYIEEFPVHKPRFRSPGMLL